MNLKPVNSINNDGNTIRVSDGNSPIRLIFKNVKGEVINLYDKIDYFYLTKDDEKFYSVTDISYDGDEVIIRLPKLRKGKYKAEIRDKDGSIYPANEDLYILLRRSFEDDKDIHYFGHREDILNNVEPMVIQHIDKHPNRFKGERGQQGFPGRDGLRGLDGKHGKDGIDGLKGDKGVKGDKGDKGEDGVITPEQYTLINNKIDKGEVSVHDINKSLGKFDGTFFTSDFLEQIQNGVINTTNVLPGTIGNIEIQDDGINVENVSYISKTKNMLDISSDAIFMNMIQDSTGVLTASNASCTTARISVKPNTSYHKNFLGSIVYYDENLNPVKYDSYSKTIGEFVTTDNTRYITLSITIADLNIAQLELGNTETSYTPYNSKINPKLISITGTEIKNESVSIDKLSGFLKSRNMIDRNNLVAGYINMPNGELIPNSSNRATEKYIPVNPGITYNLQPLPSTGENFNIAYYNGQKQFVSSARINDTSENGNLTIPSGVAFIRLSVAASHEGTVQLELGDVPTEHEPYYMFHPGIVSPMDSGGGSGEEGTQAPNYLELLGAYDVRFSFPIKNNMMSSFRFSNSGTGDDFMKGRESSVLDGNLNVLYDLTTNGSNKEFALSVSDGTQDSDWFPEHNGVSTAHEGSTGYRKLVADGNNVDISKTSNIPIKFNTAILTQKMEFSLPYDTTPRAILTFVVTIENGECKESIRVEWKKDTTVHSGYFFMTPMSTPDFVDGLLTSEFEYVKSNPGATTQTATALNNIDANVFYFTSNRTEKTDILFTTEIIKVSEPVKSLFWQHRSGLIEKLYPQQFNNTLRETGDIDYAEGVYKIKVISNANESYKLN